MLEAKLVGALEYGLIFKSALLLDIFVLNLGSDIPSPTCNLIFTVKMMPARCFFFFSALKQRSELNKQH